MTLALPSFSWERVPFLALAFGIFEKEGLLLNIAFLLIYLLDLAAKLP